MDRVGKPISRRAESYKRKGLMEEDPNISRSIRHHRRSIERRNLRDDQLNKRRNMTLSPLQEVTTKKNDKMSRKELLEMYRKEKALKAKEEESKRRKPQFKVMTHQPLASASEIYTKDSKSSQPAPTKGKTRASTASSIPRTATGKSNTTRAATSRGSSVPTTATGKGSTTTRTTTGRGGMATNPTKPTAVAKDTGVMTRRQAAAKVEKKPAPSRVTEPRQSRTRGQPASASKPGPSSAQAEKSAPSTRATRSSQSTRVTKPSQPAKVTKSSTSGPATVPASGAKGRTAKADASVRRSTRSSSVSTAPSSAAEAAPAQAEPKVDAVNSNFITERTAQDLSFIPENFKFTAPDNLPSFTFKPLSPASANDFMFGKAFFGSPLSSRRCSTPKIHPVTSKPLVHSPATSIIAEGKESSATDSSQESDSNTRQTKKKRTSSTPARRSRRSVARLGSDTGSEDEDKQVVSTLKKGRKSLDKERVKEETADVDDTAVKSLGAVSEEDGEKSSEELKTEKAQDQEMQDQSAGNVAPPAGDVDMLQASTEPMEVDGKVEAKPIATQNPKMRSVSFEDPKQKQDQDPSVSLREGVFRTPASLPRRYARRSCTPAFGRPASASKKTPKNFRKSFILRGLSPEECIEVLKQSPMIEMDRRRTPKAHKSPVPALEWDDIDDGTALMNLSSSLAAAAGGSTEASDTKSDCQPATAADSEPAQPEPNKQESVQDEATKQTPGEDNKAEVVPSGDVKEADSAAAAEAGQEPEHDIPYFRNLLKSETDRLNRLSSDWEHTNDNTPELTEEVKGQIRTTIGQAQLLIAQRFKQFSGLVDKSEFGTGEKAIHCSDLQGFWDMIYFQVEDVDQKFADLEKLKANNWQSDKPKPAKKKVVKKKPVGAKPATKGPGAAKSRFAEFRARMKQQQKEQKSEQVEEPATEVVQVQQSTTEQSDKQGTEEQSETKTFEGGFFSVSSPVRSARPSMEGANPAQRILRRSSSKITAPIGSPLLRASLEKSTRRSSSRLTTPIGSPLLQTSLERSARRSHSPSPYFLKATMAVKAEMARATPSPSLKSSMTQPQGSTPQGNIPWVGQPSIFTPETERKQSRRSIQTRSSESESAMEVEQTAEGVSEGVLTRYLQPITDNLSSTNVEQNMEVTSSTSPPQDVEMAAKMKRALDAEFNQNSRSAQKRKLHHASAPEGRHSVTRGRSMSASEHRRRLTAGKRGRRSVHFVVEKSPPTLDQSASKAPSTPFNRDSRVSQPRTGSGRTRRSRSSQKENLLFTPPSDTDSPKVADSLTPASLLAKLTVSQDTPTARPKRVSELLFTPPRQRSSPRMTTVKENNEPSPDLMSFSPTTATSNHGAGHQMSPSAAAINRSRRKSNRVSLL